MAGIRGLINNLAARLGFARKSPRRGTGYAAAEISRLTASLRSDTEFINNTLRYQLRALRARSRQAAQNNPFARRFVQMCVDNIAGPNPFKLEGWVKTARNKPDVVANEKIERAWKEYTRKGVADIAGKWSWAALLRRWPAANRYPTICWATVSTPRRWRRRSNSLPTWSLRSSVSLGRPGWGLWVPRSGGRSCMY